MNSYAVEARGLSKLFANHRALAGIDFSVRKGSVHGFLGPNGAGKTTAIKIILGLTAASAGSVKVLGEMLRFGQNHQYLRYTSYLPQEPVFPEGLTGLEALTLVANIYKLDYRHSRSRINRMLDYFQLSGAANRKVGIYSSGMQQRLGIAAVLLTEPELLILDEPVSALDPEGRRKVLEVITRLKGRATVFFSSHILADVERVCDQVTIIDQGRKLLETSTEQLLKRYGMEQYLVSVKPEQREKAASLIRNNNLVMDVTLQNNYLLIISKPGKAVAMSEELLPRLIQNGIIVTEFMQSRANLEEVFFRVLEENHKGDRNQ